MFRIVDGREYFYQWDLDRQIVVEDTTIAEVHFCNRTDECSLVTEVVNGVANVPNVLLHNSFDIRVFGYDGKATRFDKVFKVKPRTRPSDYVYTEVEIKRYEDLEKRIDEIEEKGFSEEVVDNAINSYFEKNPISFDGYATEAYVDQAIENIPEVDLSQHALKSEIPTKVSQLENDSKFITREEVPETDLSEYAKKSEIPDVSDFITNIPSEYITESELNAKGYLTEHQNLSEYAKKSEIPTVPTKVSELTNDAGYVTAEDIPEGVDTSNLLKFTTVDDQYNWYVPTTNKHQAIQNDMPIEKMDADLDRVVSGKTLNNNSIAVREGLQLRVPVTPTKDNHAASKNYVDTEIAKAQISGGDVDLSNYATKDDIKDFITEVPAEYITESELQAKGYLTEHQSLEGYATEKYVDDAIAGIEIPEGGNVDLTGYATEEYVDEAVKSGVTPYTLVLPAVNAVVTDEKTIEILNTFREGSGFPFCTYKSNLIVESSLGESFNFDTLTLATSDHSEELYVIRNILKFSYKIAEATWTLKVTQEIHNKLVSKTSELTNDSDFTTKAYVDSLFEGIATAEGGSY